LVLLCNLDARTSENPGERMSETDLEDVPIEIQLAVLAIAGKATIKTFKQEPMSDIPECEKCGVQQPWLLNLNTQVRVVNYTCNECGRQQTTKVSWND
jgi:hypothetical protein